MNSLSKDKLILDTTAMADSDNVGAYLRDSNGALITSTLVSGKQALDVNVVNGPDDGFFLEDAASADGHVGQSILSVRQDTLATSTSTDGDYADFKVNARGALWVAPVGTVADGVADTENPVKVGTRALAGPLAALTTGQRADMVSDLYRRLYVNSSANVAILAAAATVTDVAGIIAAAIGGRRTIIVSNRGNKAIYVGNVAVTAAAGFTVSAGATISIDLGENVALYAIADTGQSVPCRVLQLA